MPILSNTRVYIDMDGVLANFEKRYNEMKEPGVEFPQAQFDFWRRLEPMKDAIPAFLMLSTIFDTWILTAPSVKNPHCYLEKRLWVEDWLGYGACERLIISPNKSLYQGDYLIDDTTLKGVDQFEGKHIHFGTEEYPDWDTVMKRMLNNEWYPRYEQFKEEWKYRNTKKS